MRCNIRYLVRSIREPQAARSDERGVTPNVRFGSFAAGPHVKSSTSAFGVKAANQGRKFALRLSENGHKRSDMKGGKWKLASEWGRR